MTDQATVLRGLMEQRFGAAQAATESPRSAVRARRARTIAVTSGKGGVGKSNIALNLAVALRRTGAEVCLVDANFGLGNIDLLCGLNGYWNLAHVITGARALQEIVLAGPEGISVITGASGLVEMADCTDAAQHEIFSQLEGLEQEYDYLIVDTGAGIHRAVRTILRAADLALVIATPEPTAIADAYATIKSLAGSNGPRIETVVNMAETREQGSLILERLQTTSRVFLYQEIASAGQIPRDPQLPGAVARRTPLLVAAPKSPAAKAIEQLALHVKHVLQTQLSSRSYFAELRPRRTA